MTSRVGSPVHIRRTKWGGARHWEFSALSLGEDEHGWWGGVRTGDRLERPGHSIVASEDWVILISADQPWSAEFYPAPKHMQTYVDMTTPAVWTGEPDSRSVSMVDLDLDVIQLRDGTLFVDDEDEFADHQVSLSYPPEIVAMARRTADEVQAAISAGTEPFASHGDAWLQRWRDRCGS